VPTVIRCPTSDPGLIRSTSFLAVPHALPTSAGHRAHLYRLVRELVGARVGLVLLTVLLLHYLTLEILSVLRLYPVHVRAIRSHSAPPSHSCCRSVSPM